MTSPSHLIAHDLAEENPMGENRHLQLKYKLLLVRTSADIEYRSRDDCADEARLRDSRSECFL